MSYPVNYNLSGDKMSVCDIVFRMSDALKTVADRLKHARLQAGKTQKEMAEGIGKDITAYGHYERGRNEMPRETAIKLCEILNIDLDWLMTGRGAMINSPSFVPEMQEQLDKIAALAEPSQRAFAALIDAALETIKEQK